MNLNEWVNFIKTNKEILSVEPSPFDGIPERKKIQLIAQILHSDERLSKDMEEFESLFSSLQKEQMNERAVVIESHLIIEYFLNI